MPFVTREQRDPYREPPIQTTGVRLTKLAERRQTRNQSSGIGMLTFSPDAAVKLTGWFPSTPCCSARGRLLDNRRHRQCPTMRPDSMTDGPSPAPHGCFGSRV